jgi:hypothetical protein
MRWHPRSRTVRRAARRAAPSASTTVCPSACRAWLSPMPCARPPISPLVWAARTGRALGLAIKGNSHGCCTGTRRLKGGQRAEPSPVVPSGSPGASGSPKPRRNAPPRRQRRSSSNSVWRPQLVRLGQSGSRAQHHPRIGYEPLGRLLWRLGSENRLRPCAAPYCRYDSSFENPSEARYGTCHYPRPKRSPL